jgi:cytochrome c
MVMSILFAACGGGNAENAQPATPTGAPATTTASFQDQVAAGQKLYADNCASCHGAGGEGGKAPKVVGVSAGALPLDPPSTSKYRKNQFHTAADVADFVVHNMPPKAPGSLKETEYWDILAFDLHANGVDLQKPLDANSAKDVVLHK